MMAVIMYTPLFNKTQYHNSPNPNSCTSFIYIDVSAPFHHFYTVPPKTKNVKWKIKVENTH